MVGISPARPSLFPCSQPCPRITTSTSRDPSPVPSSALPWPFARSHLFQAPTQVLMSCTPSLPRPGRRHQWECLGPSGGQQKAALSHFPHAQIPHASPAPQHYRKFGPCPPRSLASSCPPGGRAGWRGGAVSPGPGPAGVEVTFILPTVTSYRNGLRLSSPHPLSFCANSQAAAPVSPDRLRPVVNSQKIMCPEVIVASTAGSIFSCLALAVCSSLTLLRPALAPSPTHTATLGASGCTLLPAT